MKMWDDVGIVPYGKSETLLCRGWPYCSRITITNGRTKRSGHEFFYSFFSVLAIITRAQAIEITSPAVMRE